MEKTNNFVPMFDLDRLSDDQLHQYYLDACAYHGVPPELNVLAFTLMDSGDGARRRVLYAKKGATDIIRNRLQISVVDLRKEIFNGTLTYTCFGKNAEGRLEIAVGASYIDGVVGRALEIAIMVAQTRAVRRMTLQFAGAGLLDETELQADSKTTDIKDVLSAPQPVARPNSAPGKDITQNPPIEGVSLQEITQTPGAGFGPTQAQLEAQAALSKVNPTVLAKEAGETLPEPPAESRGQGTTTTPGDPWGTAPKRRQRSKPVELDTPFSFDNPAPVPQPIIQGVKVPLETSSAIPKEILDTVPAPIIAKAAFEFLDTVQKATEAVTAVIPVNSEILNLPNEGQMKGFRDRLFKYTNDILPKAGMVPSENIGGIGMKVRIFAQQKFGQVMNQLSVEQWEEMFKLWDSMHAVDLVRLIDETASQAKK